MTWKNLTRQQQDDLNDLSPAEARHYNMFRKRGQTHEDAIQSCRDFEHGLTYGNAE